jgi:ATP-binding cassette subfamily B multidrug efflux pump
MFRFFEHRLAPFPDQRLDVPPDGFWPFVRYYIRDAVPWLAVTAALTALIAVGEVTLFGFLGGIVDWLSSADREGFLQREGPRLAFMAGVVSPAASRRR